MKSLDGKCKHGVMKVNICSQCLNDSFIKRMGLIKEIVWLNAPKNRIRRQPFFGVERQKTVPIYTLDDICWNKKKPIGKPFRWGEPITPESVWGGL